VREFVEVAGGSIEYELHRGDPRYPPLVFLHEGLGSIDLWRGLPLEVAAASGGRSVLTYARHGHGRSDPARLPRPATFLHHEADLVLRDVLEGLEIRRPVLVGHSDGASIALLFAGSGSDAGDSVSGIVGIAPHVFVEAESIAGIEAARTAFDTTDMIDRMRRYHRDPESTFRGWNDAWLSPDFREWDITDRLDRITCPVLLVQGDADQYGTFAQLDAIAAGVVGPVEQLRLAGAGHSPHLDARDDVVAAVARWLAVNAG
jgi:pimeloyl-ACP methyl ester carboxylesterase